MRSRIAFMSGVYVPPPTFPTISSLVLRLESDIGLTTSSGNVTNWVDQSSLADHYTASGTGRPTEITGQVNGYSAIRFNGTTNVISSFVQSYGAMLAAGHDIYTCVAVWKNSSTAAAVANEYAEPCLLADQSGWWSPIYGNLTQVGGGHFNSIDNSVRKTQAPGALQYTKHTLTAAAGGTLAVQVGTAGTPTTSTGNGIVGGPYNTGITVGRGNVAAIAADLFAIYVFNAALSGGDNTALNTWINTKYGPGL